MIFPKRLYQPMKLNNFLSILGQEHFTGGKFKAIQDPDTQFTYIIFKDTSYYGNTVAISCIHTMSQKVRAVKAVVIDVKEDGKVIVRGDVLTDSVHGRRTKRLLQITDIELREFLRKRKLVI